MADEKIKDFGTLLKESMENRTGETINADADTQLNDAERNAILEKVAKSKQEGPAKPPSAGSTQTEDSATVPFGVLLEQTAKIRSELDNAEAKDKEELREAVIQKSKIDIMDSLLKTLIR